MKDTIDMAREAGFNIRHGFLTHLTGIDEDIKRFEALVRADEREQGQKWFDAVTAQHKQEILAEREACAKLCESIGDYDKNVDEYYSEIYAAAIRNRGQA